MHGFKDPDIHEIERSCPTPEPSSISIALQILASTVRKHSCKVIRVFEVNHCMLLHLLKGCQVCPEGALDREVYGMVSGHVRVAITNCSQLKEEGYEMNVYEPCLFSKFAVREEPAVDGGSIAPGEFVGCVLLEVDDHLMGGPGKPHHESMERLRQRIKFGKWHRLVQDGPSFFGGRHFTQLPDRSFKVDITRIIRERLRPISLPRGAMLGQEC